MNLRLAWLVAAVGGGVLAFAACSSDEANLAADAGSASSSGGSTGTSSSGGSSSGGSSSGGSSGTSSGGSSSGGSSSGNPDGGLLDAQSCLPVGFTCTEPASCCTKMCETADGSTTGTCGALTARGGNVCLGASADCASPTECCSGACIGGKCSGYPCGADTPTGEACASNAECCSGLCGDAGTGPACLPLGVPDGGTACRIEGNPCTADGGECCGQCLGGRCSNVSFCTQLGDVCKADFECCTGTCAKQGLDELGRCQPLAVSGIGNCKVAGTPCSSASTGCDIACCSAACAPFGTTSGNFCQPPSACRPEGELCAKTEDCCGPTQYSCAIPLGETFGRCKRSGTGCKAPGAICKTFDLNNCSVAANCCEGEIPAGKPYVTCNSTPEACCSLDALGVPRCRAMMFVCTGDGGAPAGQKCATSADCCGNPCVNSKCVDPGSCVAKDGECTNNADCCAPARCMFARGTSRGICGGVLLSDGGVGNGPPITGPTCALYGQRCSGPADCCSGVPCNGGRCAYNTFAQ